jgi:hypothetical protein
MRVRISSSPALNILIRQPAIADEFASRLQFIAHSPTKWRPTSRASFTRPQNISSFPLSHSPDEPFAGFPALPVPPNTTIFVAAMLGSESKGAHTWRLNDISRPTTATPSGRKMGSNLRMTKQPHPSAD